MFLCATYVITKLQFGWFTGGAVILKVFGYRSFEENKA